MNKIHACIMLLLRGGNAKLEFSSNDDAKEQYDALVAAIRIGEKDFEIITPLGTTFFLTSEILSVTFGREQNISVPAGQGIIGSTGRLC